MYTPSKIELTNFLSHKHSIYEFKQGEAFMVIGENKDDDGQESNGSGKSALNEAISLALKGNSLRKVKDCDLIYYGEKESTITFHLKNEFLNEVLSIKRTLFAQKSKSSTLECFINGVPVTSFPTVRDGNKFILDKIGVESEDITNYFIVSKSKSVSFFLQSDTEKKNIVSRFSGTDSLLPIKEQISLDIKSLESKRSELESSLLKVNTKIEVYNEQVENSSTEKLKSNKEIKIKLKQDGIDSLNNKIKLSQSQIDSLQKESKSYTTLMQEVEMKKKNFKVVNYTLNLEEVNNKEKVITSQISSISSEIDEISLQLSEAKSFKNEIEQNLRDSINCPKCSHSFILRDESYNLEEAKSQLPEIDELICILTNSIDTEKESLSILKTNLNQLVSEANRIRKEDREQEDSLLNFKRDIDKYKNGIEKINKDIKYVNETIIRYQEDINNISTEIISLQNEEIEDSTLSLRKSIDELKLSAVEIEKEIDLNKSEWITLKELEVTFIKFITHLCNKAIKSIELRTNNYLEAMGSNLSISIEGYKVLSDGTIREKVVTVVNRNGISESFFESYSEGEKERINIACTLALNNLMNLSCKEGKGLGFMILDEMTGSLDRMGVGSVMESLSKLKQTILVISHVEPKNNFNNTVIIRKENGISTINI